MKTIKNNNNKNNENFHKEKTKMGNNSLNNITNTIDNKNINENNKTKPLENYQKLFQK